MPQGIGYWIKGESGQIDQVDRHEKWLKNDRNLEKFGIRGFKSALDEYSQYHPAHQDPIRMIGLKAGLVRVRENSGTVSVQFDVGRSRVSTFLYNVLNALESVNFHAPKVFVQNLRYNDSEILSWDDFRAKVLRGQPVLVNEDEGSVQDIPYNPELSRLLDDRLRREGLLGSDQE